MIPGPIRHSAARKTATLVAKPIEMIKTMPYAYIENAPIA